MSINQLAKKAEQKEIRFYYHVTDKASAKTILKEGLVPKRGKNAVLCGEEDDMVYLCRRKDVPYWKILLGADTVLRIGIPCDERGGLADRIEMNKYSYSCYSEYLLNCPVPPELIQKSSAGSQLTRAYAAAMYDLCESYIYTLGDLCADIARITHAEETGSKQNMPMTANEIKALCSEITSVSEIVKNRLTGYQEAISGRNPQGTGPIITGNTIRRWIKESGEGRFSVADFYFNENVKLYEKIAECKTIEAEAKKLSRTIREVLGPFLRLETGDLHAS